MEYQAHPIEKMMDQIKERGLMLIEGVNRMPIYEKPYVSPFIVIYLNHRGWLKAIYDLRPVEFRPHDLAVIPPEYIVVA